jgi:5-formyltetrahydrofolate cyclo-ligase
MARLARLDEADCLIVPGVVFDKKNNRIGHGKGYYDRFLKRFGSQVLKIGLAFSFQVVSHIPVESHDEPVDRVLTG